MSGILMRAVGFLSSSRSAKGFSYAQIRLGWRDEGGGGGSTQGVCMVLDSVIYFLDCETIRKYDRCATLTLIAHIGWVHCF